MLSRQEHRHPDRVGDANLLVLSKIDLVPHMSFNLDAFRADVRAINPAVPLLEISTVTRDGLNAWEDWLRQSVRKRRPEAGAVRLPEPEWFFG